MGDWTTGATQKRLGALFRGYPRWYVHQHRGAPEPE